jgi:hypothetical protein
MIKKWELNKALKSKFSYSKLTEAKIISFIKIKPNMKVKLSLFFFEIKFGIAYYNFV